MPADNEPEVPAKKGCKDTAGGEWADGSAATVIIKDKVTGKTRVKVVQCRDGEWEKVSDVVTQIAAPDEDEPAPDFHYKEPTAPVQVAKDK